MTYNVSLVRISNSRGWGKVSMTKRNWKKKKEKRNQEIKTPKGKRVDNIEMKLLFTCLTISVLAIMVKIRGRHRNSWQPMR
jgi:hypothetical protein